LEQSAKISETLIIECNAMVHMTLIRPLNEGRGHSFCYQSISYTTSYRLSIVTFDLGRTVYPQYTTSQTDATLYKRDR